MAPSKERLPLVFRNTLRDLATSELAIERRIPTPVHEGILSMLALSKHGKEGMHRRYSHETSPWKDIRLSDHKPLTFQQRLDRGELDAGIPLGRHSWLEKLREKADAGGTRLLPASILEGTIIRLNELSTLPENDIELEQATIEVGYMLAHGSDYDGNPFTFIPVKASEGFFTSAKEEERDPRELITDIEVRGTYGRWHLGASAGFADENANRWFISSWEKDGSYLVPLDAITEIGTPRSAHQIDYQALSSNTSL